MGVSNIRIPRLCEFCGEPFEAKQVRTRFCSRLCAVKSAQEKEREQKHKQQENLLQAAIGKIAEIQSRPYITVAEATRLFGISKDTIRRLIKRGKLPAVNLGERLTRISRVHIEAMFQEIPQPIEEKYDSDTNSQKSPMAKSKPQATLNTKDFYTIAEVMQKYNLAYSSTTFLIRKHNIAKHKKGRFYYVSKSEVDKIFANHTPNNTQ